MGTRRVRLNHPFAWEHHRSGWKDAINALHQLHHPSGVYFESFLEGRATPLLEPFVGVLHHTPYHPTHLHPWDLKAKYQRVPDLRRFLSSPLWEISQPYCRGLITLSEYTARYVRQRTSVPVQAVLHPRRPTRRLFKWRGVPPHLLFIGSWMRDYRPFFHLRANRFRKFFLVPFPWVRGEIERLGLEGRDIRYLVGLSPSQYDHWLRHSIVFLRLFDASAVNTVLDCLFTHTPVVVNRLPALEEYLGPDYPLFFETTEEADAFLNDPQRLERGHRYLQQRDKSSFRLEHFVGEVERSPIYRDLPVPGADA